MFEEMLEEPDILESTIVIYRLLPKDVSVEVFSYMMMKSPSLSASRKNALALSMASKSLSNAIYELDCHCTMRDFDRYSEEDIKKLKQAAEYVGMVETGIREYMKALSFDTPKMEERL